MPPMWEYHLTIDIGVEDTGGFVAVTRLLNVTEGTEIGARLHGETPDDAEMLAHAWLCTHLNGATPPSARPTQTAEDPVF